MTTTNYEQDATLWQLGRTQAVDAWKSANKERFHRITENVTTLYSAKRGEWAQCAEAIDRVCADECGYPRFRVTETMGWAA